jgi:hypothetical protein
MDEAIHGFLMERLAEVGEEEFFGTAPMFLMVLGYSPADICRMMFKLGELVGRATGHLCAEAGQIEMEVGTAGYL